MTDSARYTQQSQQYSLMAAQAQTQRERDYYMGLAGTYVDLAASAARFEAANAASLTALACEE